MSYTTYSFEDVTMTISNPAVGQFVASGTGIGSISIAMTTDRTAHDVSADGSVMVSKIPGRNGNTSIAAQQTSDLNQWLIRLYNYLETAPTSQWASTSILIRAPRMQDHIALTGVSFQKLPDRQYQAQGQQVTWTLMAADIQQNVV
ncbi:phage protein [Paenibacillus ginsengarvi]|uniref:phage protein n=1 Tax=Paenibacillus ginsengarvi TaxID=400777 RepID=UPI001960093A|nr:phage protein [Paenibacillus ginsengarvi]